MLLDVLDGVALGRVGYQDVSQQVLAGFANRDASREVVVYRQNALQYLHACTWTLRHAPDALLRAVKEMIAP
jgi:hypothetical protein